MISASDPQAISASEICIAQEMSNNIEPFTKTGWKTDLLIYQNRWFGAVEITRKSSKTKGWRADEELFEVEKEVQKTNIQFRPVPWLFQAGLNISFGTLKALYASSRLFNTIEPVRHTLIPQEAKNTMRKGNLNGLKRMLRDGEISISDRCHSTGANLLELGLNYLLPRFWPEEWSKDETPESTIINVLLWLNSQGLSADFHGRSPLGNRSSLKWRNESEWLFVPTNAPKPGSTIMVENKERLSLLITEEMSPIPRAQNLLLFALLHPGHSLYFERIIWDLIEDAEEDELILDELAEQQYFAEEDLGSLGIKHVLINCFVKIRKAHKVPDETTRHSEEEDGRRGPRHLLSRILSMDLENGSDGEEIVEMAANVLRLSKRALLLENDYANHLSDLAQQINRLDVWYKILKRAGYPTAEATLEGLA